eukprot:TRINITY_DN1947_c0_g1_i1.p1 TRINITY_DN1947_c0_g1~~TRINITY_DN1947_c0_g1_i1.p1  ORF type:complete len:436 (-),score=149.68 TRINITY_DN1947_c0_g1_i1:71-1378(-)
MSAMGMGDLNLEDPSDKRRDPSKDFKLLEKLGEGSYGAVWKAQHLKTTTITAIKRVPVENDLDEILNEIKIMKQCRSPYIISYYGSYFKDNELWIVMEFCGAGSVADLMRITTKTLTEDQIIVVLKDALKGLIYLHSRRKIHRDIKAGNILLNNKGEGKLADFGVSGQLSDTMAKRQTVIGTPFWMAPEVIQEVGYDVRADLWSLGITAIEMAEGKPPYSNIHPMRAIFMIPSRPPPKLTEPEKWSNELNDFVSSCLTKNPEQRPGATELLKHTLIGKAKTPAVLEPIIAEADAIIAKVGRESAMGMDQSESDEEEGSDTMVKQGTTVKTFNNGGGNGGYDTMVVSGADEGTMKVSSPATKADYVPPFMQQFNKKEPEVAHVDPVSKYANYSTDELKKMMSELNSKMDKEIEAIKTKYSRMKKEIDEAIKKKKKK